MEPYVFQYMPKLILSSSFEFGMDDIFKCASIVDDPDVLRKSASSKVVHEWGDVSPMKGASLIHLIALGSTERTGPNRNGDGFKEAFLREAHPTFKKHGALYKDHINKEYEKRFGDVEKTAYNEDMGRAELLVSARHDKCADWLHDIERGKRVDFSMGFDCKYDVCSKSGCHHKAARRTEYCEHVKKGAKAPFGMGRILENGEKLYVDNPEGVFNDISQVPTGADMIAQHLRKVAGLDPTEMIGGAEMMEAMGIKTAAIDMTVKMAIAHKLSRMEKLVPVMAYRPDKSKKRISEKVAAKLRAATPPEMFGCLAKLGSVLGLREFFKLAMGERFSEIESMVDAGEHLATNLFSVVTEDPARLQRICDNSSYNCSKSADLVPLNDYERVELMEEFSIHPDLAEPRAVKTALYGVEILPQEELVQSHTSSLQFLLDEYAAYKLAALEGSQWTMDDEAVRIAVRVS